MGQVWHYCQNGQQDGPVSGAELRQLAALGTLQRTDQVWKEGMANWVPARSIGGAVPGGGGRAASSPERRGIATGCSGVYRQSDRPAGRRAQVGQGEGSLAEGETHQANIGKNGFGSETAWGSDASLRTFPL